ncbi:SIS domain-containing protein [Crossiella cryophila]|uniref:Glutamine--fructose-6-phosphate aminotransferase [isomerizing] n=1 Tax=Crossiella cryophila TaxID=43355 RepID=A0A7W7CF72_9PSEU|nr:SIS domain-containing protein [Crossiella cryophila]MBB4678721.1 glucosamine--fructose-6-phosphate aminotransferase (isomerizing) [Crossiella cryophila]
MTTPFEHDIAEQPAALLRLAEAAIPPLDALTGRAWPRIVLTGMGSSHFAGIPTWRHLIAQGTAAWSVDAGQLLDDGGLITPDTLLIVTSQSGASGEITELLDRRQGGRITPATLVGITDDRTSPLALAADLLLPLHSGPEATVSTKSYLNTLAVHRLLRAGFAGEDVERVRRTELPAAAAAVRQVLDDHGLRRALAAAAHPRHRLSCIGIRDTAATARFAALVIKESAKIAAEGYVGGEFRHGPFELAGEGHTALLFLPPDHEPDPTLQRLAKDLRTAGSQVIVVGDPRVEATTSIPVPGGSALAAGAVVAELFAVALAQANGVVPGAFVHGRKITTTR